MERYSGVIGVRRPGDWTGRLEPSPGSELITDETFAGQWGELPAESLTLAGTTRFLRYLPLSLRTGPLVPHARVRPTLRLRVVSGRLEGELEADLLETAGSVDRVQIELPAGWNLTRVEADGLTSWSRIAPDRVALRFDRGPASRRQLRLSGWLPVHQDPLATGPRRQQAPTPWFRWPDADAEVGFLLIQSASQVTLDRSPGASLVSSDQSHVNGLRDSRFGYTYRIDDHRGLGVLSWESIPARLAVAIESQLTVHPDWAEWKAVLRYDVYGGALNSIFLKIPSVWEPRTRILLADEGFQTTREMRDGSAFWTINPERPVWGSQRLVLRSTLPLESNQALPFPEVVPLGRGSTETSLRIINATGGPLPTEGSGGLQPIDPTSRFHDEEFSGEAISASPTITSAYRVNRDKWGLRIQGTRRSADPSAASSTTPDDLARAEAADVVIVVDENRSATGSALYELEPRGGRYLPIQLPTGGELIWSSLDGLPIVPLRSAAGLWILPVGDRGPKRAEIAWRSPPVEASPSGMPTSWPLPIPRVGAGPVTTLLTVAFPGNDDRSAATPGGLEETTEARLFRIRADALSKRIGDVSIRLDRSSRRDQQSLASLLIEHEMMLRSAERGLRWASTEPPQLAAGPRIEGDLAAIESSRLAVAEIIESAGLDETGEAAGSYLGRTSSAPSSLGVAEPVRPARLRLVGHPVSWSGTMPGVPSLEIAGTTERVGPFRSDLTAIATSGTPAAGPLLTVLSIAAGMIVVSWRPSPRGFAVVLSLLGCWLALAGGPIALLVGAVAACVGWRFRPLPPGRTAGVVAGQTASSSTTEADSGQTVPPSTTLTRPSPKMGRGEGHSSTSSSGQ
jgi:hypothetical protein